MNFYLVLVTIWLFIGLCSMIAQLMEDEHSLIMATGLFSLWPFYFTIQLLRKFLRWIA